MVEISGIAALAKIAVGNLSKAAKILMPAVKTWQWFEQKRLTSFLRGAVKTVGGDSKFKKKLQEAINQPKTRDHIALLMERVRRAESVWASYCLGILLGKVLNKQQLEIFELIFADILSRLDDNDLNFLCRLYEFVDLDRRKKEWLEKRAELSEKVLQFEKINPGESVDESDNRQHQYNLSQAKQELDLHESRKFPLIRIEERDLIKLEYAEHDGLLLTRMRVDRLTLSGVFSGDIGGYGGSGIAHGTFVWHELTQKFYIFINDNRCE